MAYDESAFRRSDTASTDPIGVGADDSRFRGEPGFREEPEFRPSSNGFGGRDPDTDARRGAFDDVLDDGDESGRDRLGIHVVWEITLLLAIGAVGFLYYREDSAALSGDRLDQLLVFATALGVLALGAGLSMRAGAPNLALGPVAIASALNFAENGDKGVVLATMPALAVAAAVGVALAVLVVGFHVPGWAASFALALGAVVYIQQRSVPVEVQGGYDPTRQSLYLFGAFLALALLGGLFGTIRTVRRAVGRFRPVGDPARRRGALAATLTAGSLVLSMLFAVVAGVLFASGTGGEPVTPAVGFDLTGLAVGAALLGGTSAFGRRGGVFGTAFAVVLLTLFIGYADASDWRISRYAVAGAVVAAGLVVTRLVETFGRSGADSDEDDDWESDTSSTGWSTRESWSSALPAQPTGRTDPWDRDRWPSR
ncbi:MAG TPA: ABC transporter permease [Micromonosporaceae bacterium]|jgi:ribose/xylose/arabinose/galactoside ABC-type transport system permease subunit